MRRSSGDGRVWGRSNARFVDDAVFLATAARAGRILFDQQRAAFRKLEEEVSSDQSRRCYT